MAGARLSGSADIIVSGNFQVAGDGYDQGKSRKRVQAPRSTAECVVVLISEVGAKWVVFDIWSGGTVRLLLRVKRPDFE